MILSGPSMLKMMNNKDKDLFGIFAMGQNINSYEKNSSYLCGRCRIGCHGTRKFVLSEASEGVEGGAV